MRLLFENYSRGCSPFIEHTLSGIGKDLADCASRLNTVLKMSLASSLYDDIKSSEFAATGEYQLYALLNDLSILFEEMKRKVSGKGSGDLPSDGFYRHMVESVLTERRRRNAGEEVPKE